jgi:hypothetical protein
MPTQAAFASLSLSTCLVMASIGIGVPLASNAQQSVSVPTEIEHSSNPALTSGQAVGVTRFRVAPQYTLTQQNGPTETQFSFGAVFERSSNTAVSNHRSDPNLSWSIEQVLPNGSLGLRAALSESSSRQEEFQETGLVASDATQRNSVLEGTWRRELSDVSRVEMGLGATKVQYDTSSLVGYREYRTFAGLTQDVFDETQLTARWESSRLQPGHGAVHSSRSSLSVGVSTRPSEDYQLVAAAGTERTSGLGSARSPSSLLRLEYSGERVVSTLEWARSVAASGARGGYIGTRQLGWTAQYLLSERTSINLAISQARSQDAGGGVGSTWLAGLRHSLSDFWSVEGRWGQSRTRPNAGGSATSNLVGLMLTFSHPDF